MKMTMHVNEALLEKVMTITGASSKTAAVDLALREVARRGELKELAARGLGLSAAKLKKAFDASYDLAAARLAEAPVSYGRESRSRR